MMNSSPTTVSFSSLARKPVVADFSGGHLSSDGGLLLLAALDRQLGLTEGFAACLRDPRDAARIDHTQLELVRQRIYQIACGYEDANDATTLRRDPLFLTAVGRLPESGPALGSQPTLSRLENRVTRKELLRLSQFLAAHFVKRHRSRPVARIIIDVDPTEDPTHGQQELTFYNHHYRTHCYLPLLVYATLLVEDGAGGFREVARQELVAAVLRPANRDAAFRARAVIRRVVGLAREAWPAAAILVRADGGFARPELYEYCEATGIGYYIGLPKNAVLQRRTLPWLSDAGAAYLAQPEPAPGETRAPQRCFGTFLYQAGSWKKERLVVCKAEVLPQGPNMRWVVTHLLPAECEEPEAQYRFYCERGDPENRIKEYKCDLRADKTSCQRFFANQFRLLLAAAAYALFQSVRALLSGTQWARAQVNTLQTKLLKVAARVRESHRRVYVQLASGCPWQRLWAHLVDAIDSG
jgi:Transposase DDE domain group 1